MKKKKYDSSWGKIPLYLWTHGTRQIMYFQNTVVEQV